MPTAKIQKVSEETGARQKMSRTISNPDIEIPEPEDINQDETTEATIFEQCCQRG